MLEQRLNDNRVVDIRIRARDQREYRPLSNLLHYWMNVRNRVVSGRSAFGLACSNLLHAREAGSHLKKGRFRRVYTKSAEVCGCRRLGSCCSTIELHPQAARRLLQRAGQYKPAAAKIARLGFSTSALSR